ncbi:MAG TPA: response regulator transcription factor [Chloroflexota bacterium]|jgi:DNA-binding NarL/FixJ family response regulator|nr:response regulator transcription factor [Chloroflexota bacterium]
MIRVLLADDHTIVRQGVRLCLEAMGDIEVVAEAADGDEAVQLASELKPDVAVIDLTMPRLGGVEAIRQIKRDVGNVEVVVLSVHDSEPYVVQALRAGAAGYVLKRNAATELAEAIRAAHDGQAYLHPTVARRVIDEYLSRVPVSADATTEPHDRLSPREREVLQLAAEGHSTRAIAGLLCLSTKTVEHHRASVMTKLGLHGQTELVKYAIRAGLVEPT